MEKMLMTNTFVVSDTHFSHAGILTFKRPCHSTHWFSKPVSDCPECHGLGAVMVRPFSCVEEMDNTMIQNWNKVVRPDDKVYHLGDVAMKRSGVEILDQLNGDKRLIRGNHDIALKTKGYLK